MTAGHTPSVTGPVPAHPLAPPRTRPWAVVVLVGWLALLHFSPEQILTLVVLLFPVAAGTAG